MGQKVNPTSNRLGYIRGWQSNWFAGKKDFGVHLIEDARLREFIYAKVQKKIISIIVIERTLQSVIVTLHTSRPGVLIGPAGASIQNLKAQLKKKFKKEIRVNVLEVKNPEADASLIAKDIKEQIEARLPYKRAIKNGMNNAMRLGIEGIKIKVSGRLAGAEIARQDQVQGGRVPLHTFRADIDYAQEAAITTYGTIGIKVWVFKGEVYGKTDLSLNVKPLETKKSGRYPQQEGE